VVSHFADLQYSKTKQLKSIDLDETLKITNFLKIMVLNGDTDLKQTFLW
jgi:hypothetical protein